MTFLKHLLALFKSKHAISTVKYRLIIQFDMASDIPEKNRPFLEIFAYLFGVVQVCRKMGYSDEEMLALIEYVLSSSFEAVEVQP